MTRHQWRTWAKTHEHIPRRLLRVLVGSVVAGGVLVGVIAPIADAHNAPRCAKQYWGHDVRNSFVYPNTTPQCVHGVWTVTTPRQAMPEDAYGWNCFTDGNGACGALQVLDDNCMTDPKDGYTMCANGSVYYRQPDGTKLWPVERNPR